MNTLTLTQTKRTAPQMESGAQINAGYMAHELRAPLTAINLTLEILREQLDERLQPDERQILNIALKNSDRLGGLINDIMDFSKLQAGKIELQTRREDPNGLIGETVESLKAWSISKEVRLFCASQDERLPAVVADGKRIAQILTNLLSNALKFTPAGGSVAVSAALGRREKAGMVIFAVKDTGCGIAAADFEKIFRSFEQSSNVKSAEGTGLGLTLAKAMVELHGGRIWVESVQGMGSTFYFSLPVAN